ncbi:hypothetical protein D3C72_2294290 [compost metagenome]
MGGVMLAVPIVQGESFPQGYQIPAFGMKKGPVEIRFRQLRQQQAPAFMESLKKL